MLDYFTFEKCLHELELSERISDDRNRQRFYQTVDYMIDILNNHYFNEDSENAMDDPDAIQGMLDLKDGKYVQDGQYLSECIVSLFQHFNDAEQQQIWGDMSWKKIFGW